MPSTATIGLRSMGSPAFLIQGCCRSRPVKAVVTTFRFVGKLCRGRASTSTRSREAVSWLGANMRKARIVTMLVTAMLAIAPQDIGAQELDSRCQKILDALCGNALKGSCFKQQSNWNDLPARCHGPVQAMIEMEREALQEQEEDRKQQRRNRRTGEVPSFSCGGVLRSRPAMTSGKVASVAQGQPFDSVEDTGIWADGYKWFRVQYSGLEGYHWGGIFWTQGGREGTIPSCNG